MKSIAIFQSNYIPWKGYFDAINSVDEVVIYDDMQFTRRDWRNRNRIKTPNGLLWLSIPVNVKGRYLQKINETQISDKHWSASHWKTIVQFYSKARYFDDYKDYFEDFYLKNQEQYLSLINFRLIELVNNILGIKTKISWSSDYELVGGRTEKLLGICQQAGADLYLSGPAAKGYFDESMAKNLGIEVRWVDYSDYPEYRQLYPPFQHGVTILDLIFNEGQRAKNFMKSFR